MRQDIPNCEIKRLLSLILYKVVDPSRQIRDDALQMLETLSDLEWVEDGMEGSGSFRAAVVGDLPDSYQQFQYKLPCKLVKDHPELSQLLCEEIMQRPLDAVDIIACNEWYPKHSTLAFSHVLRLLEKGPVEYQRVILLMLKALLQHTPMDSAQSPHMYAIVSQLVESTLCWEAQSVLEALLQSCSTFTGSHPNVSGENGFPNEEKILAPQMSFKARSGPLQYSMCSGFSMVFPVPAQVGTTESGLSPKEVTLRNTRLVLGHVLDSCALGRRRDYKKLVPFVANIGNP